ncbi:uracil-DNA glycosylase [Paenibacillus sp. GCM10023248]|uniref:uracil-DNA glycosylase n=1 Tax=Bacillales TaxID=1385 RepID=UPI0023794195|nr:MULTISPECIES: uracil-DNA glycosylase [Bacillales]MDD9267947.1 uracil-DNA glycosylase [Paenibacillus sp. MAHUQ-63]MDR6882380.1 uracil-DNA glycosylase [Bacillus sp. 3255]
MLELNNDWGNLLAAEWEEPYYKSLCEFLEDEYRTQTVYPQREEVFNALRLTSYAATKVVILGQDPYHGKGQAHGLSFSVQPGVATPPSLHNMYKELQTDLGCRIPDNGYLVKWAEQGVLLLNTVLTVREDTPNSHKGKGWERFTDRVIRILNEREEPVIFVLWGSHAQAKLKWIDEGRHYVIKSVHPSPLSAYRGFFGSKPFSQVNALLDQLGSPGIDWQIPNLSHTELEQEDSDRQHVKFG